MTYVLLVVAGPNGSGKTTLTRANTLRFGLPILDPDAIARTLNPLRPEGAAIQAGRLVLQRASAYLADKASFAVETTLSGGTYTRMMRDAAERGYLVRLMFVCTESPNINVLRVRDRVIGGGHDVPESDIRRRYRRSLEHLPRAIELAAEVALYDNSTGAGHRLFATIEGSRQRLTPPIPEWASFLGLVDGKLLP